MNQPTLPDADPRDQSFHKDKWETALLAWRAGDWPTCATVCRQIALDKHAARTYMARAHLLLVGNPLESDESVEYSSKMAVKTFEILHNEHPEHEDTKKELAAAKCILESAEIDLSAARVLQEQIIAGNPPKRLPPPGRQCLLNNPVFLDLKKENKKAY